MSRLPRLVVAFSACLALAGCGGSSQDSPGLDQQLEQVDQAVVTGGRDDIRRAVRSLLEEVDRAEADGSVDADRATRIRDAAEALLAAVPDPEPTPTRTPEPPPGETPPDRQGDGQDSEESDDDEDDD
jgi:hypothetical protein